MAHQFETETHIALGVVDHVIQAHPPLFFVARRAKNDRIVVSTIRRLSRVRQRAVAIFYQTIDVRKDM